MHRNLTGDGLHGGGGFVDDGSGSLDLLARDVEMCDGAQALRGVGVH